jgi:hypothetical protein
MLLLRSSKIFKQRDDNDETWIAHLMDMKRVEVFRRDELVFAWVKSKKGEDHLHNTLLYAVVASKMLGVSVGLFDNLPVVLGKFRAEKPVYRPPQPGHHTSFIRR